MVRTIVLQGRTLTYELTRKPVKNLNLRIHPDGSIGISAPPSVPISRIEGFLQEQTRPILEALDRYAEQAKRRRPPLQYQEGEIIRWLGEDYVLHVQRGTRREVQITDGAIHLILPEVDNIDRRRRLLEQWQAKQAETTLQQVCRRLYPPFGAEGVPFPDIQLRKMTRKWGICRPTQKRLTFNRNLMRMPMPVIEYVVAHEFTHFLEPNHARAFYETLGRFMPDWKERKAALESEEIHGR